MVLVYEYVIDKILSQKKKQTGLGGCPKTRLPDYNFCIFVLVFIAQPVVMGSTYSTQQQQQVATAGVRARKRKTRRSAKKTSMPATDGISSRAAETTATRKSGPRCPAMVVVQSSSVKSEMGRDGVVREVHRQFRGQDDCRGRLVGESVEYMLADGVVHGLRRRTLH